MKLITGPPLIYLSLFLILISCNRTEDTVKVVSQDGSGDYSTVQEAFDDVPYGLEKGHWIIKIKPGRYYEKLHLEKGKDRVLLLGEDPVTTVLYFDDYAGSSTGQPKQSTTIDADDFTAVGITFLNPHQNIREMPGENSHSQATALSVTGDRVSFYNCRMVGNQDTFWARGWGRVYLRKCYVEGNVDFIYGDSVLILDECEIFANQHDSYITAASTRRNSKFGITFLDCRITAKNPGEPDHDGVPFQNFYLGRPWHNRPHVAYIRCEEPASVYPAAWTFMNPDISDQMFFEYKCTGEGATPDRLSCREYNGRQLTDEEASAYTIENIFSKDTCPDFTQDWLPTKEFRQ